MPAMLVFAQQFYHRLMATETAKFSRLLNQISNHTFNYHQAAGQEPACTGHDLDTEPSPSIASTKCLASSTHAEFSGRAGVEERLDAGKEKHAINEIQPTGLASTSPSRQKCSQSRLLRKEKQLLSRLWMAMDTYVCFVFLNGGCYAMISKRATRIMLLNTMIEAIVTLPPFLVCIASISKGAMNLLLACLLIMAITLVATILSIVRSAVLVKKGPTADALIVLLAVLAVVSKILVVVFGLHYRFVRLRAQRNTDKSASSDV